MSHDSGKRDEPPAGKRMVTAREERLAQALRANLRRRKDQARARDTAVDDDGSTTRR